MAAAALAPRVRIMAICDEVTPSDVESGVYTLEGVRQGIVADVLPCRHDLVVFLVLSCPRPGRHAGWVQIVDIQTEKVIRLQNFHAEFNSSNTQITVDVRLPNAVFPAAGEYQFEVSFLRSGEPPVLKGEQFFSVAASEE